ncbi:hypothetical protein [Alkalicoccus urumqiensis]|nr:hypothetical protein [Alkalicoccus urumqiensis]
MTLQRSNPMKLILTLCIAAAFLAPQSGSTYEEELNLEAFIDFCH